MATIRKLDEKDLKRELEDFRERYPHFKDHQLFLLWFLRAFITENEVQAADALVGGPGDKGIDAILVDGLTRNVFISQGKYRTGIGSKNESRGDILGFAKLAPTICGEKGAFDELLKGMSPEVSGPLKRARSNIIGDGYKLCLYYVTTGKCSKALDKEAQNVVKCAEYESIIRVFSGNQLLLLLADYLDGVAPPVPSLDLEMESGDGVEIKGVFQRYDSKTNIESWVFSMSGNVVGDLFEAAGDRLFARNVRGFLGSTQINQGMKETIRKEPEHFWYYNNGITVICDRAEEVRSHGRVIMRATNPQVINGQQTTRTLALHKGSKASVSVRVIRVPRESGSPSERFDVLVSSIVAATNCQNTIKPSDLMSNDRRQIEIERQMRKLGYWYIRKRQTKQEAKRGAGSQRFQMIKKEELAQAVAACDLDPIILVQKGKEGLFEKGLYGKVFPNSNPDYYLTRYWLMKRVGTQAWGYPERKYAKWVVLNFVWPHLKPHVNARKGAEAFRGACERGEDFLNHLDKAIKSAFVGALRFYRSKRGTGARAIDVSTFFKRKGLHTEFQKFWRSGKNTTSRGAFSKSMKKLQGSLKDYVE